MPRQTVDQPITTRNARLGLKPRSEPYWRGLDSGVALGFRKGTRGGFWVGRVLLGVTYKEGSLGRADDALKADGATILDYRQAAEAAKAWAGERIREAAGLDSSEAVASKTVRDAIEHYLVNYEQRGGRAIAATLLTIDAHILPTLGDVRLNDLRTPALRAWLAALSRAEPRRRTPTTGSSPPSRASRAASEINPDRQRARRATANRVLTVLKAALNLASRDGWVASDEAWRRVQPFQKVDAPKIAFLDDAEATRLANACPADFRTLVVAALLTGARYGELTAIRASDVDLRASTLHIARSKSGKARHVHLTAEGLRFFEDLTAGRSRDALLLVRSDGHPWGKSHQCRPLATACRAASITPTISFHALRHTYASRLARSGTPMLVIAAQLGHADTRITARHYAHLAPDHIAAAVRAGFAEMGLHAASNVKHLAGSLR